MGKAAILARIRKATGEAPPPSLPSEFPASSHISDPLERFRLELGEAGGTFFDGCRSALLGQAFSAILHECETREIVWDSEETLRRHRVPFRFRGDRSRDGCLLRSQHPLQTVDFPIQLTAVDRTRQTLDKVILSVTSAACAIAETGTVVHEAAAGSSRLLPVLPPNHVVLLRSSDLVPTHRDYFDRTDFRSSGSATTFITGPSRTADIEKVLVIGVHGPKRLFVILTSP